MNELFKSRPRKSEESWLVELPQPLTRLDRLGRDHEAQQYMRSQGLDPDVVGRIYQVSYWQNDHAVTDVPESIIIPFYKNGKLHGWQSLGDFDHRARGQNQKCGMAVGMELGEGLYNLDTARKYHTGILVVDPMYVWAVGPMAVSPPFGLAMNEKQCWKFLSAFSGHSAILLVHHQWEVNNPALVDLVHTLTDCMPGRFTFMHLEAPQPATPKELEELHRFILREAKNEGVQVSYDLRS